MTTRLQSLKSDDNFTWLSLTNNEIGINIQELTEALQPGCKVRKVSCHAGFLGSLNQSDLRLLVTTIAKLSQLQDLWLALPAKYAFRSSDILRILLSSPYCQIKKLTLRGMDDAGCKVLADALKEPGACMTELQVRGTAASTTATESLPPCKVTRRGILAIASMLEVNRSLERLDICYKGLDKSCCQAMARALLVNETLQKLDFFSPSAPNNAAPPSPKKQEALMKGYNALVETMKTNGTLNHINTGAEGDPKIALELFAKLNRTGARALMRDATDDTGLNDVLQVLQSNIKDASALYELLRIHPALWDPVKANVQGLADEEPIKRSPVKESATSCATSPKPVMARWKEDIFTAQEREKAKNFVRWTPTIIPEDEATTEPKKAAPSKPRKSGASLFDLYSVPAVSMNVPGGPPSPRKQRARRSSSTTSAVVKKPSNLAGSTYPDPSLNLPCGQATPRRSFSTPAAVVRTPASAMIQETCPAACMELPGLPTNPVLRRASFARSLVEASQKRQAHDTKRAGTKAKEVKEPTVTEETEEASDIIWCRVKLLTKQVAPGQEYDEDQTDSTRDLTESSRGEEFNAFSKPVEVTAGEEKPAASTRGESTRGKTAAPEITRHSKKATDNQVVTWVRVQKPRAVSDEQKDTKGDSEIALAVITWERVRAPVRRVEGSPEEPVPGSESLGCAKMQELATVESTGDAPEVGGCKTSTQEEQKPFHSFWSDYWSCLLNSVEQPCYHSEESYRSNPIQLQESSHILR